MRRILKRRPSPAMVVAFIALLLALGTSAYAQLTIPRNSVGTPQLKRNAVTSAKVRNGSLLRRDFRAGQLLRGVTVVTSDNVIDPVATCPPGRVAIGGGGSVTDNTWYLYASRPVAPAVPGGRPTAWSVSASDTGPPGTPQPATAYVICAAP